VQYELKIDKELESLCPALSADELRLLEESIAADGCRDEIVLWANHDKTVIDGHNRYRICERLKKPYKTMSLAFGSKDEVKLWMLRNQMGRRNLTDSQRAMLAARMVNLNPGDNQHTKEVTQICRTSDAANHAAVSPRTVTSARKVIEKGTPELQAAVTNGAVSVSAAAEVAKKPKAEQKKIVAKGPEAVKAAAKKSKEEVKAEPESGEEPAVLKPSGGITFDPAEFTPSSVKDGFGDEVTGELRPAFELLAEFKEKRQQLTNLKTWITQRMSHPGAAILATAAQRLKSDIDTVDRELKFAAPHCECVYCKNKMPKVANCEACKGRGWIPIPIYSSAPKDMKRA
jgi:hypothetical protein